MTLESSLRSPRRADYLERANSSGRSDHPESGLLIEITYRTTTVFVKKNFRGMVSVSLRNYDNIVVFFYRSSQKYLSLKHDLKVMV